MPNATPMSAPTCSIEDLIAGHAEAEKGAEERRCPRRRVLVPGVISVPGYRLTIPCRVVDMSAMGAGTILDVRPKDRIKLAKELPDNVVLILKQDRVEVDCRVQWRNGTHFGVRFMSRMRPTTR